VVIRGQNFKGAKPADPPVGACKLAASPPVVEETKNTYKVYQPVLQISANLLISLATYDDGFTLKSLIQKE
jgi:hypothetical protein